MYGKMGEIVSAANTFTVRNAAGVVRVKTLLKSLSVAMERTVSAIATAKTELCMKVAEVRKLEAAADAFVRGVARHQDQDDDFDF